MKKILALLLAVMLIVTCFAACGKKATSGNGTTSSTASNNGGEDKTPVVQGPDKVEVGAANTESALANTFKLLHSGDKKLTIGYLGGSITYGGSATKIIAAQKGGIELSYVNRISNWFKETYPEATIETVNAGVSDTATNFGIYRLEKTLMNTDGHDMPDLVFIEYTTNDWFYNTQTKEDLLIQIESLILNIWELNPYAEIIFLSTNVAYKNDSNKAYKEIGEKYNIPLIDVGATLRKAKKDKCGKLDEASGTYYYTTDNLHPSAAGYQVYFDTIKPVLEENLKFEVKDWKLYDYKAKLPAPSYSNLIRNPVIITSDKMTVSGNAAVVKKPISVSMYDTKLTLSSKTLVDSCVDVKGTATITAKFSGATLGFFFDIKDSDKGFKLRYQIDGGEWKEFGVHSKSWSFQMYAHAQVFMMAHNLSEGEHTIKLEFEDGAETFFGGILANGK